MQLKCACVVGLLSLLESSDVYVQKDERPKVAVLIDTDPALTAWLGLDVDDDIAMAFLAGTPHVSILGASSTFGNALASTTCLRLKKLLDELGLAEKVPLACGPTGLWSRFADPMSWFGGFANHSYSGENSAVEQLVKLTKDFRDRARNSDPAGERRLVWLSLGAMTNVAAALQILQQSRTTNSGATALPDEVLVLGARSDGGWELNVWSDASAAEYVLVQAPTFVPISLVPIDAVAGAVVGVRQLDQFRKECQGSWINNHIGVLKRYAWIAGHLQKFIAVEPHIASSSAQMRPVHGFRPWDVAAAAAVAYPGQLFAKSACYHVEQIGSRIRIDNDEVPCEAKIGVVRKLSHLAVPQFIAVMFNGLCTSLERGVESSHTLGNLTHDVNEL